ncbi:hypothetical protein [Neobacillus niacini]|uniref:hypothetical protein n=1 Tax=Neobacillus niacini TaxID=86668 RepID=UPI0039832CE7
MGKLEQVDQLETYIDDLGKEIGKVKKASDYLKLIEKHQEEISKTSTSLIQTKDQLKLYQEIIESKLELFQTTAKNIEARQQAVEQTQFNIIANLAELKLQQEKDVKGINDSMNDVNKKVSKSQETLVGELTRIQEEQNKKLISQSKTNKIYFMVNTALIVILGVLVLF